MAELSDCFPQGIDFQQINPACSGADALFNDTKQRSRNGRKMREIFSQIRQIAQEVRAGTKKKASPRTDGPA
ncbi:MAG: hypothetical protein ACP5R6_09885 [Chlorobaculum sp.]